MARFKEMDRSKARAHLKVAREGLVRLPKGAQAGRSVQRLRVDAAHALGLMRRDAKKKGFTLKIASAWRKPWKSRAAYEAAMKKRYKSVAEGQKWVAFESFHHRGVAVDFGSDGLEPKKATRARQKKTKTYKWLVANAHKYGFYNYTAEPWHWEFRPVGIPASPPSEPWQDAADFNPGVWALAGALSLGAAAYFATEGDPLSLPEKAQSWAKSASQHARQTTQIVQRATDQAMPRKVTRTTRRKAAQAPRLRVNTQARGAA